MKKLIPPTRRMLPVLACCLPLAVAATPATTPKVLLARTATQPTAPITGRIVDAKGEGVPGVTVLVKGTSTGTNTDADGRFSLDAPAGATLILSSIGFVTQEVPAPTDGRALAVTLQQDNKQLDEVVVMGYTVQDRQNLSSAVSTVNVAQAKKAPVASITEAIQGRTTGVQINNSGNPGQSPNVVIRGLGSLNGGSSLSTLLTGCGPWPTARASAT